MDQQDWFAASGMKISNTISRDCAGFLFDRHVSPVIEKRIPYIIFSQFYRNYNYFLFSNGFGFRLAGGVRDMRQEDFIEGPRDNFQY